MTDTSEYKEMFIEESREHLNTLNQSLLDFEKNPKDKNALNTIFRAAHTIKGMSATMNYEKIKHLAHKTEDTLDLIRNNQLEVDSEVIDLIFKCFDGIETMVEDIAQKNITEFDIDILITELEKHLSQDTPAPNKTQQNKKTTTQNHTEINIIKTAEDKIKKSISEGKNAFKLYVTIDKACAMRSIRAFILLKKLTDDGTIVHSNPKQQDIEDGKFQEGFDIYYITNENKEDIEKLVNSVSEIASKEIYPLENQNNTLTILKKSEKSETEEISNTNEQKQQKTDTQQSPSSDINQKTVHSNVQTIRIGMDQLDLFMNLIGELVISKGRLSQIAIEHKLEDLSETINTVDRLTTELQDKIMMIRMIPMKHIFDRFPRMVRDLSRKNGKKINFQMQGEGIELDRTILDEIGDPLVHLLRNSIDHGIESPEERKQKQKPEEGTITLTAERTRNHVVITIQDDGKGIDPELMKKTAVQKGIRTEEEIQQLDDKDALNLIWLPGFSTAEKVTNVSGRGVGMDVVKSTIEKLNGSIELHSEINVGSTFSLRLPLTMAIFKALFIGTSNETYAIPISNVCETVSITEEDINYIHGEMTTVLRNQVLPLVSLHNVLDIENNKNIDQKTKYIVVVQKEEKKIGLIVDKLLGEQEITIKNIGGSLKKSKGIAGVTITGDGHVVLVIDINTLID